jgi:isopentenyl phosphate kinase
MNPLALIKVGGSLITDKTKPLTTREDMMRTVAQGLRKAHEAFPETSLIVANGAGSFGHYLASQKGGSDPNERILAIHESVVLLNKIFVQHLTEEGLPAVTVIPSDYIQADHGRALSFDIGEIQDILSINSIPVLFGDIVADGTDRGKIFSTESIFEMLVEDLHKEYSIAIMYLGETEGVLDESGATVSVISSQNWKDMGSAIKAPEGYDVTGGMTHKIESALKVAPNAKDVRILSGKYLDAVADVLAGKDVGTKIVA